MLSFTIAHIAIVALRLKDPSRDRPYRAPWNVNWKGKPVPLTAVLGAMGTGAAFVSVVVLHQEAQIVGTGWMIVGMAGYFPYRRQELDPMKQYRIPPGAARRLRRGRLPLRPGSDPRHQRRQRGDGARREAGRPRCRGGGRLRAQGSGAASAGRGLEKEEREARRVLELARLQAKVAGCRVRCRLLRTRNPGRAIVDEAKERRSDLIYISTEHAPSEERLFGPTARYVLANRPCRVVVEHDPTAPDVPNNGRRAFHSAALQLPSTAGAGPSDPAPASAHPIRR